MVTLIPKKKLLKKVTDLRLIALCNVVYRIIAKMLANRLNFLLKNLISKTQSAFVPGQLIIDNIMVAFEVMHWLKWKRTGTEGYVALKVDISKAYDRMEWPYLEEMLRRLVFVDQVIGWSMICVCLVKYHYQVGDAFLDPIIPQGGLRQGDRLSPYLFIIWEEGLSIVL